MARVLAFFCLVFAFAGVQSAKDPEADFSKLPKLFHLDDFVKCLERTDGIFCLGQFDVYSDVQPNPIYDIILEKSQDIFLYNRTYLHRGYCLPVSCPSTEVNETARFERCVDEEAREYSLRARLSKLHYCRAHGQPRPGEPDTNDLPHQVLLYFVYIILVMAVVGTVYDLYSAEERKNPLLMSFSLRTNWNKLTARYKEVDPRLRDLEFFHTIRDFAKSLVSSFRCDIYNYAFRYMMGIGLIHCHVYILTAAHYQQDPRVIEKLLEGSFRLGGSLTYTVVYILMASFLTAYNLLLLSEQVDFSLKHFPLLVLKRMFRFYPVYLLLNGFAATWYKSFGDGPMWPVLVAAESDICRKKFWPTAAFLQNFINRKQLCLVQTWIMAVDLQLHLFTLFLTLVLLKHRQHAIKVLSALFVAASAWLAYKAFREDLIPTYLYMTPEVFRNFFVGTDSFFDLYIHPASGALMALVGTMMAFIHKDHQERGIKISNSKVLVFLHYLTWPIIEIVIILSFVYVKYYERTTQNFIAFAERVFTAIAAGFIIYSIINHKSILTRSTSLPLLTIIAKLSLSMSMCHWCITALMINSRWGLHETSLLRIITDILGVHVLSNLLAVPLTLLVEYPLQRFFDRLLSQSKKRWFPPLKAKPQ